MSFYIMIMSRNGSDEMMLRGGFDNTFKKNHIQYKYNFSRADQKQQI